MSASLPKSAIPNYCDMLANELGFDWCEAVKKEIQALASSPKPDYSYLELKNQVLGLVSNNQNYKTEIQNKVIPTGIANINKTHLTNSSLQGFVTKFLAERISQTGMTDQITHVITRFQHYFNIRLDQSQKDTIKTNTKEIFSHNHEIREDQLYKILDQVLAIYEMKDGSIRLTHSLPLYKRIKLNQMLTHLAAPNDNPDCTTNEDKLKNPGHHLTKMNNEPTFELNFGDPKTATIMQEAVNDINKEILVANKSRIKLNFCAMGNQKILESLLREPPPMPKLNENNQTNNHIW
jgi:hypothetical protein